MVAWSSEQVEIFNELFGSDAPAMLKKAETMKLYQMPFLNCCCVLITLQRARLKSNEINTLIKEFQTEYDPFNALIKYVGINKILDSATAVALNKAKRWDDNFSRSV